MNEKMKKKSEWKVKTKTDENWMRLKWCNNNHDIILVEIYTVYKSLHNKDFLICTNNYQKNRAEIEW